MAKKTKKPKLTEEDEERLEQCFRQVRDHALRRWYDQAQDKDPHTKAVAQARLQLQLWLREKRTEIAIRKQERDTCKANEDTDALTTARKKLKQCQSALIVHIKMTREGLPASTTSIACQRWFERSHALGEILGDFDLDRRTEFGVNKHSLVEFIAQGENLDAVLCKDDSENTAHDLAHISLEDRDMEQTVNDRDEAENLEETTLDPTSIWSQHALHMQDRYRLANVPDFAIETKLAVQKKRFDRDVDRERQLYKAIQTTLDLGTKADYPFRPGTNTTWNSVLVTTTFSEHSLWELTSPILWRHFEGGLSWDYPQWTPSGVMRVQTLSNSSYIYFDFGARTFSTQRLSIPATVSTRTLTFPAQCHQTDANVEVEMTFLAQGFVKVYFPVLALVQPDMGCKTLPIEPVTLTGLWMGPVE